MMGRSASTISRELTRNRRDRGGTRELGRRSIHGRPEAVENREEFGHWEGDLMQFSTQRGNLITWCERKTRFAFAAPLKIKNGHQDWRGATGGSRNLAAGSAENHLVRQRHGVRSASRFDCGAGNRGLILRPPFALAARYNQEHQRHFPPRHAQENRPFQLQRPGHRRSCLGDKLNPVIVPRIPNPRRSLPRKHQPLHLG